MLRRLVGRARREVRALRPRLDRPAEVIAHTEIERILPPAGITPRGDTVLVAANQFDYGDPSRGISYEETAFLHSLLSMGFEVRRFDYHALMLKYGRERMNQALVESVHIWRPRLAFFVLTQDQLDLEVVRSLSGSGTTTMNWFTDDQWRFDGWSRSWAQAFDVVVTTSEKAAAEYRRMPGVRPVLSQFGFDPNFFRKLEREKVHDVVFIGQPHGRRREIIERLRTAGIEVVTRGVGWPEGRASFSEMAELTARARINLNLSMTSRGGVHQVKGRDFEVPGAGELLLTQDHPDLARHFVPGEEVATYRDEEDILPQVRALLADEPLRTRIAAAGFARALREHTYRHRFETIFSEIGL